MTESQVSEQRNINTSGGNYNERIEGDYIQGNYYAAQEEFVKITLENLESEFQDLPDIKTDIVNKLKAERLLVLGSDLGVDKNELALQLAFIVAKDVVSRNENISIKQWKRNSNNQVIDLDIELRNTKDSTIFVLTEIEPQKIIFYSLPQAHQTAKTLAKHWVVASTDRSFTSWHLEPQARVFFPELTIEDIYSQDILMEKLQEQLEKHNLRQELEKYLNIDIKYKSLEDLVKNLNNIKNVFRFVELFRQELEKLKNNTEDKETNKIDSESSAIHLVSLLELAKNDEQFIRRLYYKILKPHEQLLALGLSFFNGCFEDQLFAAFEQVILNAWRKRDPSLPALDYCDLEELKDNYFDFSQNDLYESTLSNFKVVETKTYRIDIRYIKIISLENRRLLYKLAWESHRRQIVNALDVLVDMVKESVEQENKIDSANWELYGDPIRRKKLYSVISQTISDIGLVSTSALSTVQGPLLRLATDNNPRVRDVAASAIGRWCNPGNKQQQELFRTLQIFYDITLNKEEKISNKLEEIDFYINEKQQENKLKSKQESGKKLVVKIFEKIINFFKQIPTDKETEEKDYYLDQDVSRPDYIGATIAVAIGNVINVIHEHNGKNRLSEDLYKWLEELLESRLRLVHLYFGYHTLFWVVLLHIKETRVSNLLKEITQKHRGWLYPGLGLSLIHAIANNLAHAYNYPSNRQEIQDILNSWYDEAVRNRRSEDNRSKKITQDDALLKTVVLTYGLINYDDQESLIQVHTVLSRLEKIFKKENKSYIRNAVVFAICKITYRYFEQIEVQLQDLLSYFKSEEQEEIVRTLTAIYLEQRVNINGQEGEVYQRKIRIQERRYQLWIEPEQRPLTDIEKAMNDWSKLKGKATTQQIAIQALVSFAGALGTKAQYQ